MKEISAALDAKGLRIGIVVSRFNDFLTRQLKDGAIDCIVRHGGTRSDAEVAWVPGSFAGPACWCWAPVASQLSLF